MMLSPFMPDRYANVPFSKIVKERVFQEKNVVIKGELVESKEKLPLKKGFKSYVLIKDIRHKEKKILVYVPEDFKEEISFGQIALFRGKMNTLKNKYYAASLNLENIIQANSNSH
jgi:hypothetical protein